MERSGILVRFILWLGRLSYGRQTGCSTEANPSTTVVTNTQSWYLGSGFMDGGRNHVTTQRNDARRSVTDGRGNRQEHRGRSCLRGRYRTAIGPVRRPLGVPPAGLGVSTGLAPCGRAEHQRAAGRRLWRGHPLWPPVCVE